MVSTEPPRRCSVSAADPFLRAVLAHPDDDQPRLVYADWLDEQGDPRGEFIRLQVELARHGPAHPRHKGWMRRAAELFLQHGREWGRPLQGWVRPCRFRRGFVETVFVDWRRYDECAAAVRERAPVREVLADVLKLYDPDPVFREFLGQFTGESCILPLGFHPTSNTFRLAVPAPVDAKLYRDVGLRVGFRVMLQALPADRSHLRIALARRSRHESQTESLAIAESES